VVRPCLATPPGVVADPPAGGAPLHASRPAAAPGPFAFARPASPAAARPVLGVLLLAAPAGASAEPPNGSAVPASPPAVAPPAPPPGAAAAAAGRPTVEAVTCRTGCLGLATATAGSVVRVAGEDAGSAASIVFLGRRGRRDDAIAPARALGPAAAEATLPAARTAAGSALSPPTAGARPARACASPCAAETAAPARSTRG